MKGWELLKEIAEGNIKEGTKMNVRTNDEWDFVACILEYTNDRLEHIEGREIGTHEFCSSKYYFEIIEEQEKIDIQNIKTLEELAKTTLIDNTEIIDKIDELIQAIKQLDKEIKEGKK